MKSVENKTNEKLIEEVKKERSMAVENVSAKYYGKNTKVWGKSIAKKENVQKLEVNRFMEFAELFAFRLMKNYDNPGNTFHMLGDDHFLLADLLNGLGTFCFCCDSSLVGIKVAKAVVEFASVLRIHYGFTQSKQNYLILPGSEIENEKKSNLEIIREEADAKGMTTVRQGVLFAILHALNVLPSEEILENEMKFSSLLEWTFDVQSEDSDEQCRDLSGAIALLIKKKLHIS